MNDNQQKMLHLVRVVEGTVGKGYKVAGFGSGETETYCIVITASEYPDTFAVMDCVRMLTEGVLMAMKAYNDEIEAAVQEEEVIKH